MHAKKILVASALAVSLSACQTMNNAPKQTMGTLLGGAMGGLAGSQVGSGKGQMAAVGVGVLLGGLLGQSVGKSLDDLDKMKMQKTTNHALEKMRSGSVSSWTNPDSGNSGTVTPMRTFKTASGYCREFQQKVIVGGKEQDAHGTACRKPDGTWEIKS